MRANTKGRAIIVMFRFDDLMAENNEVSMSMMAYKPTRVKSGIQLSVQPNTINVRARMITNRGTK
jgi:hypothetical protein